MSGGGDQVGAWHASTFSTRFIINYTEIKSCYKLYLCKFCGIAIKYTQAQDHDYDSNFTQRECSCYIASLCWQEVDCLTEIKLVYQILGQLFVWKMVVVMCILYTDNAVADLMLGTIHTMYWQNTRGMVSVMETTLHTITCVHSNWGPLGPMHLYWW